MADKVQLNTLITPETREVLRQTCQERGLAQGDMVEAALRAFVTPKEERGPIDQVWQQLTAMDTALVDIVALLRLLLDHREAQAAEHDLVLQHFRSLDETLAQLGAALLASVTPEEPQTPAPTLPIATYDQMYGPLPEPSPDADAAPVAPSQGRASRLRQWFFREEQA